RYVRFFILDVVLACAGPGDGATISASVGLLRDLDEAVRWKAMQFLARATVEQLIESEGQQQDPELQHLTQWLLDLHANPDASKAIRAQLGSESSLARIFAAVSASRIGSGARDLLLEAAASSDLQVRAFALD